MRRWAASRLPRQAGASAYEFVVCLALLAILAGVLLSRIAFYQREAERVAVEYFVGTLREALAVAAIDAVRSHGEPGLRRLAERNPIELLSREPRNYLGEYYSPEIHSLPKGNWVFDRRDKCLIYLLKSSESFVSRSSKLHKFKVKFISTPFPAGISESKRDSAVGVILEQVDTDGLAYAN